MAIQLTEDNYYLPNKYLTNSKIRDWLKSKHYFYQKHIEGSIPKKTTDAMLRGSAVDCWLTEGRDVFDAKYIPVARRNLKNPPDTHTELTLSLYEDVVAICERVESLTAYKELEGFDAQVIYQHDTSIGIFDGLAGKPDWVKINGNHAIIVDLKTASTIEPSKYLYHCFDYDYFRAQAMYQNLLKVNHPEVETIESYHFVVEVDPDNIFNAKVFKLNQEQIEQEKDWLADFIANEVANETEFKKSDVSFSNAIEI